VNAPSISLPETARRRRGTPRPHVLGALVRRDWLILRSYRTPLITDIVSGFINLVVYYFISRAVHPNVGTDLSGAPTYFAFATAGIALAVVLTGSTILITRRLREEQLTGTLEMLVAQPISAAEIALGIAGFPFLFATARALFYLGLAALVLGLPITHLDPLGLVVALAASGLAFVALGVALGAVVMLFKRADAAAAALVTGMALLGGAFFPTHVLSSWLEPISYVVPTRYAFEAVRGAQFGHTSWLGPSAILIGFTIVALPIALAAFGYAIRRNIRRGTLQEY
jgi:ABC-2 type transport system permease protein